MSPVKDTVKKIILKHGTNCPFEISRSKGIIISYADLGDTHGFYFCDSRIKFININQRLSKRQQRIVCAHELGHAILHPKTNTPFMKANTLFSVDKIEIEANIFAAHLLISEASLQECLQEHMTIYNIASLHNVPVELAELRCRKLF